MTSNSTAGRPKQALSRRLRRLRSGRNKGGKPISGTIAILGVFMADVTFRADRMPSMGETIAGNKFTLGPGGKGSNQAVAAARAGGRARFIAKLGRDAFGEMALEVWKDAGVVPEVIWDEDGSTGAASIFVHEASGDNAIIICPGAAGTIAHSDVDAKSDTISGASVFVTQLEQPLEAAQRGLEIARKHGVMTILNPAPARDIPRPVLALCDLVTPNETEAEAITGVSVTSVADADTAAKALIDLGAGAALITLGENGSYYRGEAGAFHVAARWAGTVVETTGAGDAFNGSLACALADGALMRDAIDFATATAAISVTRPGAAASMPDKADILKLLNQTNG